MAQEDRELALANACMLRRVQFQIVRCPFDTLEENRMSVAKVKSTTARLPWAAVK
jgi:hypothetical protein